MKATSTELTFFDYLDNMELNKPNSEDNIRIASTILNLIYQEKLSIFTTLQDKTPLEHAILGNMRQATEFMIKLLRDFSNVSNLAAGQISSIQHLIQQMDAETLQNLLTVIDYPVIAKEYLFEFAVNSNASWEICQILLQHASMGYANDLKQMLDFARTSKRFDLVENILKNFPETILFIFELQVVEPEILNILLLGYLDYGQYHKGKCLLKQAMEQHNHACLRAMIRAENQLALPNNPSLKNDLLKSVVQEMMTTSADEAIKDIFKYLTVEMLTPINLNMYFATISKKHLAVFKSLSQVDGVTFPVVVEVLYLQALAQQAPEICAAIINQMPAFLPVNQSEIAKNPDITPEYQFTEKNLSQYLKMYPVIASEKVLPLLVKHHQWKLIASHIIAVAENPQFMSRLLFLCVEQGQNNLALYLMNKKPAILEIKQQDNTLLEHILEHANLPVKTGNVTHPLLAELEAKHNNILKNLIFATPAGNLLRNAAAKNLWHFFMFALQNLSKDNRIHPALIECLPEVVQANHFFAAETIILCAKKTIKDRAVKLLMEIAFKNGFAPMLVMLGANTSGSGLTNQQQEMVVNYHTHQYNFQYGPYMPINNWVQALSKSISTMKDTTAILQKPLVFSSNMESTLSFAYRLLEVVVRAPDISPELKDFINGMILHQSQQSFCKKVAYQPGQTASAAYDMNILAPENLAHLLEHPDYLFLKDCKVLLDSVYAMHHWLTTTRKTITGSAWYKPRTLLPGYEQGMPDNMATIEKALQALDKLDHPLRVVGIYLHVKHLFMSIPAKDRHPATNKFYQDMKSELLNHSFPMQAPSAASLLAEERALNQSITEFVEVEREANDILDEFDLMEPTGVDSTVEFYNPSKGGIFRNKHADKPKVGPQDEKPYDEKDDPGLGL